MQGRATTKTLLSAFASSREESKPETSSPAPSKEESKSEIPPAPASSNVITIEEAESRFDYAKKIGVTSEGKVVCASYHHYVKECIHLRGDEKKHPGFDIKLYIADPTDLKNKTLAGTIECSNLSNLGYVNYFEISDLFQNQGYEEMLMTLAEQIFAQKKQEKITIHKGCFRELPRPDAEKIFDKLGFVDLSTTEMQKDMPSLNHTIQPFEDIYVKLNSIENEFNIATHYRRCNDHSTIFQFIALQRTGLVRAMIKDGFDINRPDKYGRTCLTVAVKLGDLSIVALLIEHGANLEYKYNEGKTAYEIALEHKQPAIAEYLKKHMDLPQPKKSDTSETTMRSTPTTRQ